MQHCTGKPSTRMVQAPQEPSSQPSFVPVRLRLSRSTSRSKALEGAATSTSSLFTRNLINIFFDFIKNPCADTRKSNYIGSLPKLQRSVGVNCGIIVFMLVGIILADV